MALLTLIRHAKSDWADAELEDFERPLNARGERDAPKLAKRAAADLPRPTLMISSPAVRAITTAKVFAKAWRYPAAGIWHDNRVYEASPSTLLNVLRERGGTSEHVVLVGHNPGMSQLAALLTGDESMGELPTCAVVTLETSQGTWSTLSAARLPVFRRDQPKGE